MQSNKMRVIKTNGAIFILLLLILGFASPIFAQSHHNSLRRKTGSVLNDKMLSIDSTQSRIANKIDEIANVPEKFAHFSDSLNLVLSKYTRKLDSVKIKLTHRIDSLQRLNLPTRQYTLLLDSIEQTGPLKDVKQAEARLASLERKTNEPVTKLNAEIGKSSTCSRTKRFDAKSKKWHSYPKT